MKCDGLIAEKLSGECFGCEGGIYEVYGKEEVDEAIAELKEQLLATKRALWLTRAERAKEMCQRLLIQGFDPKWQEVERKCRAKAEEYK